MTTGLSYDGSVSGTMSYIQQVAEMAVVPQTDSNYVAILPMMITYAENRIYRDLDLLQTFTANTSFSTVANNRNVILPAGTFVTYQEVNVITPAGQTNPDSVSATRNALIPTTKEFLNQVYNSDTGATTPIYFAPLSQNQLILGPWPDSNYTLEIIGTVRPASMSSSNLTTYISLYLPDLFIIASLVYISAYQRNFGRMSDDPMMAQSYESQYQSLLKGAGVEEFRKKFEAGGWSSMTPAVVATPTRG
jgi:hypothetical protein